MREPAPRRPADQAAGRPAGTATRVRPAPEPAPRAKPAARPAPAPRAKPAAQPAPAPASRAKPAAQPAPAPAPRAKPAARPAPASDAAQRPQRPARSPGASRAPFVLLVLGLLGGGLICLLIINTTLSTAQFNISNLQHQNSRLSQREQTLQQQIATDQSPSMIEKRAFRLGMRQQQHLKFLNLRTGRIQRQPGHIAGLPRTLNVPGFSQ